MIEWESILREHGCTVWRTVYRWVRNDADAADCFQETFLAAWHRQQCEPVQSWKALLTHIGTLKAFACLRTRHREQSHRKPLDTQWTIDAKCVQPDNALLEAERADAFRQALAKIDPLASLVFCMAYFEELSYAEIAKACSISVSYVGVLCHRAKRELQNHLNQSLYQEEHPVT